jgi:zinc-ribbon domain
VYHRNRDRTTLSWQIYVELLIPVRLLKLSRRAILIGTMSAIKCVHCGADLLPEVNFCRQCGAAATTSSELPTAMLSPTPEDTSTRRLDARVTSPERGFRDAALQPPTGKKKSRWLPLVAIVAVLAVSMCVLAWFTLIRPMRLVKSGTAAESPYFYPGSQTVMDATTKDGRAMHLQTADPLNKVVAWYTAKLQPAKTVQLTQTITVLRSGNVTATIASEGGRTNILIKEASP